MYRKKNGPLVSVIIPVYNVEKYLARCIQSVVNQTYLNLEILLVNDGSTDSSGKICDHFAENEDRVQVIHKKNGGLSDARNVGLDIAQGEWITFVDSDDWVSQDYIEFMLNIALEKKVQIVSAQYVNTIGDKEPYIRHRKDDIQVFDNIEGIRALLYQKYFTTSAGCKLYKKKLWEDIRFPKGKLYEDVTTIYEIFKCADSSIATNRVVYFYYQRQDSIVRQKFSVRKMDYVENSLKVLEDIKKRYPELTNGAISRLVWAEIHVLVQMNEYKTYYKEYIKLWSDIKKYRKLVIFDPNARIQNKIVLILSFGGIKALKRIYDISK